jgi:hypothetical protein
MRIRIVISALFILSLSFVSTMSSVVYGQAVPAGVATVDTSLNPLAPDGVFHYALSASEIVQFGYYGSGEVTSSTALSGDVAYRSKSLAHPFGLVGAVGVLLPNRSGQGVTTYENVSASQGYLTRKWVFNVEDTFTFLPESPTTGLSGVAGVGDVGVISTPEPGQGPTGGILTVSGDRFGNTLDGSVERKITPATSISGSGSWSTFRFLDSQAGGLDYTEISGVVAVNHEINQRSTASVDAVYTVFDYSGSHAGVTEPNFQTRGINVSYQRLLSRTLTVSGSIGPLWLSSSNSALIPSSLDVAGSGSLIYSRRFTRASVFYSRHVNGGSGVLPGALSDVAGFEAARTFGRDWVVSIPVAYTHSSGLTDLAALNTLEGNSASTTPVHEVYETVYGGVQVRRRFSTNLSGYLSYTVQNQSTNYSLGAQNALSGTSQTFGIGITFAPRSTGLGQF